MKIVRPHPLGVSNPPSLGRPFFVHYNLLTFGAEPKDYEVYDFILKNYNRLRFSPAVSVDERAVKCNPKRAQREVHRSVQNTGIGTKSQQALKLQQEQAKMERRLVTREQREAEKRRQYELKQQKKKEKRRGR